LLAINFVYKQTERGGAKEIIADDSYGIILENNKKDLVEKGVTSFNGK